MLLFLIYVCLCSSLTFVPNQGDDRLDIRFLVGLLHHAEPILQILEALEVGDVVNQENPLHRKNNRNNLRLFISAAHLYTP